MLLLLAGAAAVFPDVVVAGGSLMPGWGGARHRSAFASVIADTLSRQYQPTLASDFRTVIS